ncbi:MAG: hypothetical protein MUC69_09345 [Gemmatimonadales bacterium]|jgi:hypothetical protein|nr:hypothetical protein [Gemmatimonadales bacterium]
MTAPRDWDRELAKIDRAIERMPAAPAGAPAPTAPGPRPAATPAAERENGVTGGRMTTWLRVVLVLVLAAAMPFWPYPHRCGTPLFLYLGASGVVVLAGLWGALGTWRRRLGLAHVLSLLTLAWGVGLVLATVLPRVGYAADVAPWLCQ